MRASLIAGLAFAVGFAPGAAVAQRSAVVAYKAEAVVSFFLESARNQFRPLCVGTAAACPPPVSAAGFVLVNFPFDSDGLTEAAKDNLDQFAAALRDPRLEGRKFEIDGYADATGAEPYNLDLSQRRAASVVAYLASKGLDRPYQLIPKGRGASKAHVSDPFSPANRRVEARMFGAVR